MDEEEEEEEVRVWQDFVVSGKMLFEAVAQRGVPFQWRHNGLGAAGLGYGDVECFVEHA